MLFVLLLLLGVIFREQYAKVRDAVREKVVGAAKTLVGGIQTSELSLQMPSLTLGANSKGLTGSGEQINDLDNTAPTNTGSGLVFDEKIYPYRAMLNDKAKLVYNQVYENALKLNTDRFTLVTPVTEAALADIMNAVYNDHPALFWVDTAYSYGFIQSGSIVTVTLSFNDTVNNIARAQAEFDRAVEALVSDAKKLNQDVDREKYVHDYLIDRVQYDTAAEMNQSAYSALVGNASVCAGFSRAFQHVLMQLGIPCYYSTGTAAGGDHAWNIVALGDDYYNVDVAWDDATALAYGKKDYSYFNVPDSKFMQDHTRSAISGRLPHCFGTAMSYHAVYGKAEDEADSVQAGGSLPTYVEKGFTKQDIIKNIDAYNTSCRDRLLASGVGRHTFTMVLQNAALMHEVYAQAENNAYVTGYAQEVVNTLRLQNCSVSLELSGETLSDGYILLTQTITLSGDEAPAATPPPTKTPMQTPAPLPVIETPPPLATESPTAEPTQPVAEAETPAIQQAEDDPWAIPNTPEEHAHIKEGEDIVGF